MEYVMAHWEPGYIVSVVQGVVGFVAAGLMLGCMVWLVGYVVHHLLKIMRGGNI